MNNKKIYVTMTDTYLSGWGPAKNKICKFVYECDSMEEAEIVAQNARNRSDQKDVNIRSSKPHYNFKSHMTQWKDKAGEPSWYTPGYFKKR